MGITPGKWTKEIDRLRADNAKLRGALQLIARTPCDHGPGFCAREVAQAALEEVKT